MTNIKPVRIQLRRDKGWKMPENTIKVDRTTGFGSPFPIVACTSMGQSKKTWCVGTWTGPGMWFCDTKLEASELSVKAFRAWFTKQETLQEKAKVALKGKNLACWCALPQPGEQDFCHAAVLLEIANDP